MWICTRCHYPIDRDEKPCGICASCHNGRWRKVKKLPDPKPREAVPEAQARPRPARTINVIGDRLKKHFDYSAGCVIDSKSQRRRIYKEKGMNLNSAAEYRRNNATNIPAKENTAVSYPGQKDRRSADERNSMFKGLAADVGR